MSYYVVNSCLPIASGLWSETVGLVASAAANDSGVLC